MPILVIEMTVFVAVADGATKTTCSELDAGLANVLPAMPFGEPIMARVQSFRVLENDEIRKRFADA